MTRAADRTSSGALSVAKAELSENADDDSSDIHCPHRPAMSGLVSTSGMYVDSSWPQKLCAR